MACQSLDNDEILNVRWATEDPNPESKVAEKRRLEDMGREAIQSKMDPKIIEAMRAVRALEEGVEYQDEGPEIEEMDDDDVEERGAMTYNSLHAPSVLWTLPAQICPPPPLRL